MYQPGLYFNTRLVRENAESLSLSSADCTAAYCVNDIMCMRMCGEGQRMNA